MNSQGVCAVYTDAVCLLLMNSHNVVHWCSSHIIIEFKDVCAVDIDAVRMVLLNSQDICLVCTDAVRILLYNSQDVW